MENLRADWSGKMGMWNQKSYWQGYRAAKAMDYECGENAMYSEYSYGLNGKSDSFCRGWARYMDFRKKQLEKSRRKFVITN